MQLLGRNTLACSHYSVRTKAGARCYSFPHGNMQWNHYFARHGRCSLTTVPIKHFLQSSLPTSIKSIKGKQVACNNQGTKGDSAWNNAHNNNLLAISLAMVASSFGNSGNPDDANKNKHATRHYYSWCEEINASSNSSNNKGDTDTDEHTLPTSSTESSAETTETIPTTTLPTNYHVGDENKDVSSNLLFLGIQKEEYLNAIVEEIIQDPSIPKIPSLPLPLERRLYKSIIQLLVHALSSFVTSSVQGTRILEREIQLLSIMANTTSGNDGGTTTTQTDDDTTINKDRSKVLLLPLPSSSDDNDSDKESLQQVTTRLLEELSKTREQVPQMSHQVPTAMELQIAMNSIQLFLRIIHTICSSISIPVLGHQLRLVLVNDPMESSEDSSSILRSMSCSMTSLDLQRVRTFAKDVAGIEETDVQYRWWDTFFVRKDFVHDLHTLLYGLTMVVLEDVVKQQSNLGLVGSNMEGYVLDLVQPKETDDDKIKKGTSSSSESIGFFATASFAVGVGMGVSIMALLTSLAKR